MTRRRSRVRASDYPRECDRLDWPKAESEPCDCPTCLARATLAELATNVGMTVLEDARRSDAGALRQTLRAVLDQWKHCRSCQQCCEAVCDVSCGCDDVRQRAEVLLGGGQ